MIDDTGTTSYTHEYTLDAVGNRAQINSATALGLALVLIGQTGRRRTRSLAAARDDTCTSTG